MGALGPSNAGECAVGSGHCHPKRAGSPSSYSVCCLLCAEAASCVAARAVYLMLTDRHINSLTLSANGDPGLKTKNPKGIAVRFHKA